MQELTKRGGDGEGVDRHKLDGVERAHQGAAVQHPSHDLKKGQAGRPT
jgi:hypothetical protein